jgi:hypothetical protein
MSERWIPATAVYLAAIGKDIKCPFCGYLSSTENSIHLCGGCGKRWKEDKKLGYAFFGEVKS